VDASSGGKAEAVGEVVGLGAEAGHKVAVDPEDESFIGEAVFHDGQMDEVPADEQHVQGLEGVTFSFDMVSNAAAEEEYDLIELMVVVIEGKGMIIAQVEEAVRLIQVTSFTDFVSVQHKGDLRKKEEPGSSSYADLLKLLILIHRSAAMGAELRVADFTADGADGAFFHIFGGFQGLSGIAFSLEVGDFIEGGFNGGHDIGDGLRDLAVHMFAGEPLAEGAVAFIQLTFFGDDSGGDFSGIGDFFRFFGGIRHSGFSFLADFLKIAHRKLLSSV